MVAHSRPSLSVLGQMWDSARCAESRQLRQTSALVRTEDRSAMEKT